MTTLRFTIDAHRTASPAWAPAPAARRDTPPPSRYQRLLGVLKTAWHRHRSREILAQMDDFALRDIGLTRTDAHYEANKPFWRT